MLALNAAERRGALVVLLLLAIGAGHDLWRARRPHAVAAVASDSALATDSLTRSPAGPVVDLNHAGVAELDALPGIGPVLARRILEHRQHSGPFRRVEELRAVRGVGPRLLERLRKRVSVTVPPPSAP